MNQNKMISMMLVLTVFLLNPLIVTVGSMAIKFATTPTNATVTEGDDAYFTCIGNFGERKDLSIKWLRNDDILSEPYPDDKYTIERGGGSPYAILRVKKVTRTDSLYAYTCGIMEKSSIIKRSSPVYLNVRQVPSAVYPECNIETVALVEGKTAFARCRVERINPEPELKWFRQGQEVQSLLIPNDNFIIIEHEFIPKMTDNGNILSCTMTTPARANYVSNCSTGALNIDYKPRVNVTGPKSVAVGKEVLFVCWSRAKPAIHRIEWSLDPQLSANNYVLESKNLVLRIFKAQLKDNGTKVKCTVTNTVGTNSSETLLIVKERAITDPTITTPTTDKKLPPKPPNMDSAMILSIAGCTLLLSTLVITMILCYHHICRIHRQTLSMTGEQIAQPQIYFEPKDMVSPPCPPDYSTNHYIWRTVGIQVPSDGDIESVYTEIDEGKKKITSLKSISV
ncbi:kin of IRRE-like protein 2 [Anneissia japonica]|uniref:kin of IRRE-like protein 2 n=1 Tax=Anneissia japonica TaxID=1529436 RepID=UPI0014257C3C|nr:kin of IRRE-like protein 2 [Anneissia japonica]